jgi:hypothetical protein
MLHLIVEVHKASEALMRFRPPPGAQMIRLSSSMVTVTRTLAWPARERFSKLQNAFQVMKDTGKSLQDDRKDVRRTDVVYSLASECPSS